LLPCNCAARGRLGIFRLYSRAGNNSRSGPYRARHNEARSLNGRTLPAASVVAEIMGIPDETGVEPSNLEFPRTSSIQQPQKIFIIILIDHNAVP
jgi:hypothetical protein